MPKHFSKERKQKQRYHVVRHDFLYSPACLALSGNAFKLLGYLHDFYMPAVFHKAKKYEIFPTTNGNIVLTYNEIIRLNICKKHLVKRCFDELIYYGFIEKTFPGGSRLVSRFALTFYDYGKWPDTESNGQRAPHTYRNWNGVKFKPPKRKSMGRIKAKPWDENK